MIPEELSEIRSTNGRTARWSMDDGELTVLARFLSRSRPTARLALLSLLVSWSISLRSMAQDVEENAGVRPAGKQTDDANTEGNPPDDAGRPRGEETSPDTPDQAPEGAEAEKAAAPATDKAQPSSGADRPAEATSPIDEPLQGTVAFAKPLSSADRGATAADASRPIAGSRPTSSTGERRDDASADCEPEWMRDGFYLRIFDGVGFAHLSGDGPSGSTSITGLGSISALAIGGSVAPRLALAFVVQAVITASEFEGGPFADATLSVDGNEMPASETAEATASLLGGFVDWYPVESLGLHLGLGVGLNTLMLVNAADDSTLVGIGGGATLVAGYDWPVARTWAFGIALVASGATNAVLMDTDSGDDTDYDLMPFSVGLSGSILHF